MIKLIKRLLIWLGILKKLKPAPIGVYSINTLITICAKNNIVITDDIIRDMVDEITIDLKPIIKSTLLKLEVEYALLDEDNFKKIYINELARTKAIRIGLKKLPRLLTIVSDIRPDYIFNQ